MIGGTVLSIQAQKLHSNLHVDNHSNYVASYGWLHSFQHCHGISQVKINSEARSADKFFPIFKKVSDNDLMVDKIYNADETAFYFRMLQHNGFKERKDHAVFNLCTNKTGSDKLKGWSWIHLYPKLEYICTNSIIQRSM